MITKKTIVRAIKEERLNPENFIISTSEFTFKDEALPVNEWGDIESETIERWNGYLDKVVDRMLSYNPDNVSSRTWRAFDHHNEYCFGNKARESNRAFRSNMIDHFGYCE